jgi:hypothetical protein
MAGRRFELAASKAGVEEAKAALVVEAEAGVDGGGGSRRRRRSSYTRERELREGGNEGGEV